MDFKAAFLEFFASFILFLRNLIFLILFPYRALRKIVLEPDRLHLYFLFFLVFLYLVFQEMIRPVRFDAFTTFLIFLFNFYLSVFFIFFVLKKIGKDIDFEALQVAFAYTLVPTLAWFFTTLFLYKVLPPPRTTSFLGVSFSLVYLTFSSALFFWKVMLFYLVIRFLSGIKFFRVLYVMLLYTAVFLPYFILLYFLKIFRVPLI